MKKWNLPSSLLVLMLFGISMSTLAQATHIITLRVNTENLNLDNPASFCELVAGPGTVVLVPSPIAEFTIEAEVGDTIRWQGESIVDQAIPVQIKKIKYDRGVNIFPFAERDGEDIIEATITKGNTRENDYKYVISFKIGGIGRNYHIDPKISVK